MNRISRLWAALVTGFLAAFVIPAAAWAAENDLARRSPRGIGGFGIFGLLCCLVVAGVIGVVIYLIIQNQKKKR